MLQISNSPRRTVLKRMRALKRSFRKSSDLKGERAGKVKTLVEHTTSPCSWATKYPSTTGRSTASQWWAGPLCRTGSDKWVAGKRRPIPGSRWQRGLFLLLKFKRMSTKEEIRLHCVCSLVIMPFTFGYGPLSTTPIYALVLRISFLRWGAGVKRFGYTFRSETWGMDDRMCDVTCFGGHI